MQHPSITPIVVTMIEMQTIASLQSGRRFDIYGCRWQVVGPITPRRDRRRQEPTRLLCRSVGKLAPVWTFAERVRQILLFESAV
jgi:hypothetical protein